MTFSKAVLTDANGTVVAETLGSARVAVHGITLTS